MKKRLLVLLSVLLMFMSLTGCKGNEQTLMEQEAGSESMNAGCSVCGINSTWANGKKKDMIGLVNLVNGQATDMELLPYDAYGRLKKDGGSKYASMVMDGNGRSARFWMDSVRGMCTINLSWVEAETFDLSVTEELYCDICMDKIKELKTEQEKYKPDTVMCPFVIVDYQTGEIYSLNGIMTACLIRDYFLDLKVDGENLKALVVYVPEREYK